MFSPSHVVEILDNLQGMLRDLLAHNQPGYFQRLNFLWSMWSYATFSPREFEQVIDLLAYLRSQLNEGADIDRDRPTDEPSPRDTGQEARQDRGSEPYGVGDEFPPDTADAYRGSIS